MQNGAYPSHCKSWTLAAQPKVPHVTNLGQLQPVALTPSHGKSLEGYVTTLALAEIQHQIDQQQSGNLKGLSSAHVNGLPVGNGVEDSEPS